MEDKISSEKGSTPIIIQPEGAFSARIILTETNYDVRSQLIEMHIAERQKLSYIRGISPPPTESAVGYEKWYAENQKVKKWLLMYMKLEIMKRYLRLPTTQEIWVALSKNFNDKSNELQVFILNQKAFTAKHNRKTLSEYYRELIKIFRELDHRDKVVMKDPDDIKMYRTSIEQLRVHIFLPGLNGDFEQVRGEILRKEIVPDLEECYYVIRCDEICHITQKKKSEDYEASAIVA